MEKQSYQGQINSTRRVCVVSLQGASFRRRQDYAAEHRTCNFRILSRQYDRQPRISWIKHANMRAYWQVSEKGWFRECEAREARSRRYMPHIFRPENEIKTKFQPRCGWYFCKFDIESVDFQRERESERGRTSSSNAFRVTLVTHCALFRTRRQYQVERKVRSD